ncbi:MAG: AAA family ATPase [Candidatus Eremiobacterota bacterium]
MRPLPLGIQTFKKIIRENYLYIDKTKEIYKLITSGNAYFISRPRRFGKSLLVSILKEIFTGNKELFRGLYIYDKLDWKKYPVINIDFTEITYSQKKDIFVKTPIDRLIETGKEYDINLENKNILKSAFRELIKKLSKIEKVVLLIDEYDKPIIDLITDKKQAMANREILREFYSVLKSCDEYIKFAFLTGVSKFSKVSIFSGLNNLEDITLDKKFSTILGITEKELKIYFSDYMAVAADKNKSNKKEMLQKIKEWYDGYSWDGEKKLFNHHSILSFFKLQSFGNYWFSTGTPAFLIKLIREENYELTNIEKVTVSEYIFDSYDIENMDLTSLLFQTGYLTIESIDKKDRLYTLTSPNSEVKESLLNYLLGNYIDKNVSAVKPLYIDLRKSLEKEDLQKAIQIVRTIFAGIPYTLHIEKESYYHSPYFIC